MKQKESKRFEILYDRHLKKLKLQGKSKATISAYSRAVRRITEKYDYFLMNIKGLLSLSDFFNSKEFEKESYSKIKILLAVLEL